MTWDFLITADPRFADLLTRAEATRDDGMALEFCRTDVWYGRDGGAGFARPLRALLADNGREVRTPEGNAAYHDACSRIYEALPECRHVLPAATAAGEGEHLGTGMSFPALHSPATAFEGPETVHEPSGGTTDPLRPVPDLCPGSDGTVPPDVLRDYQGRVWCADCRRFLTPRAGRFYRRHRLPTAPPLKPPRVEKPPAPRRAPTARSAAITAYLLAHAENGVSTVRWGEVAALFGVSRERVRQLAVRAGITVKRAESSTVLRCPDCGEERAVVTPVFRQGPLPELRCIKCVGIAHRKPALQLRCDGCGKDFERVGKARIMHMNHDRRKPKKYIICPACFAGGLRPQNIGKRAAALAAQKR